MKITAVLHELRSSRRCLFKMASSGMLRRIALVRTDVSKELSKSFIKLTRIGELGTKLAVTSNRHTLRRNVILVFNMTLRFMSTLPDFIITHIPCFCLIAILKCKDTCLRKLLFFLCIAPAAGCFYAVNVL
jgi:hypothetical protein